MAEVYAARVRGEAGFQKLVAVKRMLPQLADDEEFTNMFLDEARVAANISSPNCVSTIDLGRAEDGSLYIVMELVVGVTLARLLKWSVKNRRPIPVHVCIDLLCQAAHGLHDAHEASTPLGEPLRIIHRDVSPQNVLVGVDGRVRLTDFGVARAVQRMTETVAGRVKGKFAYMAPEQLTAQEIDRRADLFSLGVVSWEFFTGQRLFVGEHPAETMDRVRNMPILSVSEVRPDVPEPVAQVVASALERNRDLRCPTAREFEQRLRSAAMESGIHYDKDEVVEFVKRSGGDALGKIRENIKLALTARPPGGISNTIDQHVELGLTPSGVQSAVQTVGSDSHDTEPESNAGADPRIDMDASAPSAAAVPGEVITQVRVEEDPFDVPVPLTSQKSRGAGPKIAVAVLIVLVGFGVGAFAVSGGDEDETVETPTVATEPLETSAAEPDEEEPAAEEPTVVVEEAETEQSAADEASEESEQEAAEAESEAAARAAARRRRWRGRRRGAHMTTATTAAATPEPTPVMNDPDPPPRMNPPPRMSGNGLVGLDAFDQGLMR
jgi:serine/threonine-protein kinase